MSVVRDPTGWQLPLGDHLDLKLWHELHAKYGMQQQELFVDEQEWAWCEKNQVRIISPDNPEYPEGLRNTLFRPQTLYVMGESVWLKNPLISVVGSRSPSSFSLIWLEKVLTELVGQHGWVTVSGGARGIDQKVHQMSLRCKKPTIVFVPAGLANPYPKELMEWYKPILDSGGAVISQFRPFLPMKKSYFCARNCLIAGISPVTLAVECRRRSGTWLTAKQAEDNSRQVLVMPTHPLQPGLGGLDLIIDAGAKAVRDAADVISICRNLSVLPDAERQKYYVGQPAAKAGGQVTCSDNGFKTDKECPIDDNSTDANDQSSAACGAPVGDGSKAHA